MNQPGTPRLYPAGRLAELVTAGDVMPDNNPDVSRQRFAQVDRRGRGRSVVEASLEPTALPTTDGGKVVWPCSGEFDHAHRPAHAVLSLPPQPIGGPKFTHAGSGLARHMWCRQVS